MKKSFKKNQIIIVALTVLLGVAGYISFMGKDMDRTKDKQDTEDVFAENEIISDDVVFTVDDMNISAESTEEGGMELNSDEDEIGNAVLASTDVNNNAISNIRLNREQARSKEKEHYLEIINGDGSNQAAVDEATKEYMALADRMENESKTETLLIAKGFNNAIVSISSDSVDVVVDVTELSVEQRAQIEDIVQRNTGFGVENITISTFSSTENAE